jgi:hypothetical protein
VIAVIGVTGFYNGCQSSRRQPVRFAYSLLVDSTSKVTSGSVTLASVRPAFRNIGFELPDRQLQPLSLVYNAAATVHAAAAAPAAGSQSVKPGVNQANGNSADSLRRAANVDAARDAIQFLVAQFAGFGIHSVFSGWVASTAIRWRCSRSSRLAATHL